MTTPRLKNPFNTGRIFLFLCSSLMILIQNSTFAQQDTSFATQLLDSSLVLKPNDPIRAKTLCLEAISIFQTILAPSDSALIKPYSTMGNIFDDLSEYDNSIEYHHKSLGVYQSSAFSDPYALGSIYNNLGNVYGKIGKSVLSIDYLLKSDAEYEKKQDKRYLEKRSRVLGNIGVAYRNAGQIEESLKYYRDAIKLNHEVSDTATLNIAINYVNYGVSLGDVGFFDEAIDSHESAREIISNLMGETHLYVGICFNNLGLVANHKGDIELSKKYYTKALEISLANESKNLEGVAISYNNLGTVYRKLGDFDKALDFYQKSKIIISKIYSEDHRRVGDYYGNVANVYSNQGKYEEANLNLQKSVEIFEKSNNENELRIPEAYSNLAILENDLGDPVKGIFYAKKSLELALENSKEDNIFLAVKYGVLGDSYNRAGIYPEALNALRKSEEIYLVNDLNTHPELAGTLAEIANVHFKNNDFNAGWSKIRKVLSILEFDLDKDDYSTRSLLYNAEVIDVLNTLKILYRHQIKKEEKIYQDSLVLANRHILALVEYRIQKAIDPENKRTILEEAKKEYAQAIDDYLNLDQPEKAFALSDKMKARTLSTSIQKTELADNFNIPDSMVQFETRLLSKIGNHEKNIHQIDFLASNADSTYKVEFNKLFNLKEERDQYYANLKNEHLGYWQQVYEPRSLEIKEIQSKLNRDQCYLQYFVQNDSSIFTFLISKDEFISKRIKSDENLHESILHLMQLINKNESKEEIHEISSKLYASLIEPFQDHLKFEILITPDGLLNLLPYEILRKDQKYLIEDHCLSYHYSTQLWEFMEYKELNEKNGLLALAPSFDDFNEDETMNELKRLREGFGPLLYNQEEAKAVADLWGGEYLSPEDSSLEEFLIQAPQFEILHLATHGKADDRKGEYSYLLLKSSNDSIPQKLYVKDLYGLNLSNQLVVLSACETGIGEVQQGEGIMSMAHGFAMSGSQAIVPTLWSINDKSSAKIIIDFFSNLKDGEKKNEALRNAKLDFLKSNPDASPFYWAPFIAIGDINPILQGLSPSSLLFLVLAFLLSILIGWRYLRNNKQKPEDS